VTTSKHHHILAKMQSCNNGSEGQGGQVGQKHKYTFSQLISSVEELKKKFEVLKSENNMLKENTDNIIKQVLNMESQLISNGCIIEKFKSKIDDPFDQLLLNCKDVPEPVEKISKSSKHKEVNSPTDCTHRTKKTDRVSQPENSTNIKIEKVEQLKQNIKEEIDDEDEYQEELLEEEACLDAEEETEMTEAEYVEVQNHALKIETDETQANIFDIKGMAGLIKPIKKEASPEPGRIIDDETATTNNDETDSNSNSSSDNETDESDTDNEADSVKPKEYSLKRLHMDLVEYLDKNRKKPKLTPTKKQYSHKEEVYCVCKSRYRSDKPMIGCDGPCKDWYHFNCVGIPKDFRSIAEWYCEECFLKISGGSRNVCLCGGTFEPAHELIRCRGRCKRLYHPGCLGLDNEDMVMRWDKEGGGQCGFCNG